MKRQKLIPVLGFILVAGALAPAAWHLGRSNLQSQMLAALSSYGFNDPQIGSSTFADGYAVFTDIALDPDKFSTIRAIQAATGLGGVLLQRRPREVVIDDVRLTGSFTGETGLNVSGWTKGPLPFPAWNHVTLNGGQIDLDTSAGALRFQAKGQGIRQPDGGMKIQSLVWGVQNQIKLDTVVTGVAWPDGKWNYDIELRDGGMNFDKVKASRMSGWLSAEKTGATVPEISGQIDAGRMNIGDLAFSDFNVAFEGPLNQHSLIAKAKVHGFEEMLATLDLKYVAGEPQIKAVVETASLDDLLTFLKNLRNSETDAGTLTSLLLTQGNLDRLSREIRQLKYHVLELHVHGHLYDLAGNVVVKTFRDGTEQRHVISLDPGNG